MQLHVYVARHAESIWNAQGRWQGQADPPLSEEGRHQASALAARYASNALDAIISSDLKRAVDTALTVSQQRDLELQRFAELREMDVGDWAGLTRAEVMTQFPQQWDDHLAGKDPRMGGGENRELLQRRVTAAFDAILTLAFDSEWRTVLIVTHGGVVREIALHVLGIDTADPLITSRLAIPRNASVAVITSGSLGQRLVTYNDTAHLTG